MSSYLAVKMAQNTNTVDASKTTIRVAEAVKHLDGAGVTVLANHLSLPKSTIHNHLQTLIECEFIVEEDNEYHLGLRFLDFGMFVNERIEILDAARNEVDRLADETGELVNLMIEEHGWGVYVYQSYGDRAVNTNLHVGKRVHLHQTAQGKAILTHYSDERTDEIIDRHGLNAYTENTTTDREELETEMKRIAEQGYAYDDEEWMRGLRCVAAPILNRNGDPLGAIGISGPTRRLSGEMYDEKFPDLVQSSANVIELNMEYPNRD
jgi:DNA-binding IclR family transcriptional regulator